MNARAVGLLGLALAGCFEVATPKGAHFLCRADADCPPGDVCDVRPGEDGCCVPAAERASLEAPNPTALRCGRCADPRGAGRESEGCRPRFSSLAAGDATTCGLVAEGGGLKDAVLCLGAAADNVTRWYRGTGGGPLLSAFTVSGDILCGIEATATRQLTCRRLTSADGAELLDAEARQWAPNDEVSVAGSHVCGRSGSQLRCFPLSIDAAPPGGLDPNVAWKSVVAGAAADCGINDKGVVRCWPTPPAGMPLDLNAEVMKRSSTVGCRLLQGKLNCWAETDEGKPLAALVIPEDGAMFGALAVGDTLVCALPAGGGSPVRCWSVGPLAGVSVESGVEALAAGKAHACASYADVKIRCWGVYDQSQAPPVFPAQ